MPLSCRASLSHQAVSPDLDTDCINSPPPVAGSTVPVNGPQRRMATPAAKRMRAAAGVAILPAPSSILVWVGCGGATVEMVVVFIGTGYTLGT